SAGSGNDRAQPRPRLGSGRAVRRSQAERSRTGGRSSRNSRVYGSQVRCCRLVKQTGGNCRQTAQVPCADTGSARNPRPETGFVTLCGAAATALTFQPRRRERPDKMMTNASVIPFRRQQSSLPGFARVVEVIGSEEFVPRLASLLWELSGAVFFSAFRFT